MVLVFPISKPLSLRPFCKRSAFSHNLALSSGCVRVHNPQEMALYILSGLEEKTRYTQGRLDTIIKTHKTRSETLTKKIPVFITYLTVFADTTGNHIRFGRDIYGRDEKLLADLK